MIAAWSRSTRSLLVFCAFALALLKTNSIYATPCTGFTPAAESGDSTFNGSAFYSPSVNDLVLSSAYRNAFFTSQLGVSSCYTSETDFRVKFDGSACSSANGTYGDVECASRRLLNAFVFLDKVPHPTKGNWRAYVSEKVDWTEFHFNDCGEEYIAKLGLAAHCGTVADRLYLSHQALFDLDLIERAGLLAHEARHSNGDHQHCNKDLTPGFWAGGLWYGPYFTTPCACPSGGDGCDKTYAGGGAYAIEFDFLDAALNVQGLITSPFLRKKTLIGANSILLQRFQEHPGFLLRGDAESSVAEATRKPWDAFTAGPIQIAWAPDPDGPVEYIQGLGVGAHGGSRTMSRLSIARGKMEFKPFENKVYQTQIEKSEVWYKGGDIGNGPELLTPHPQRHLWITDPTDSGFFESLVWSPMALTRLALKAETNGAISHILGRRTGIYSGYSTGTSETNTDPSSPTSWDVDVTTSSGYMMTGLSLGMAQSGTARVAGIAWNQRLGPEYKPLVGGLGGGSGLLSCSAGYIAIGTQQKAADSQYGPVVGYFALVCAKEQYLQNCRATPSSPWIPCGDDPTTRRIRRASYREGSTYYGSGTYLPSSPAPAGITTTICPPLSRLRGIVAQSGVLVDRINSIRCTNGFSYAVDVGGVGGALKTHDCWYGTPPAIPSAFAHIDSVYFRSGDRLDGFAPRCAGPYDTTMTFDFPPGKFLDESNTFGWQVNITDFERVVTPGVINYATLITNECASPPCAGPRRVSHGTGPAASWNGPYGLYRGDNQQYATLTRPALDLRGAPAYQTTRSPQITTHLKFRYHMYTPLPQSDPGHIAVLVRPTGTTTPLITGTNPLNIVESPGDYWQEASVPLTQWHGQIVDVQIRLGRGLGFSVDIAIDDVRVVTEAQVL